MNLFETRRLSKYRIVLNYMNEFPMFKILLFLSPLFFTMVVIGEVNIIMSFSEMLKTMKKSSFDNDSERSKAATKAIIHAAYIVGYYVAILLVNSTFVYYTCRIYRSVVIYYLLKILNIDKHTYTRMSSGEIKAILERKAFYISKVIELIFVKSVYYVIFILYTLSFITIKFGLWILLFTLLNMMIFLIAVSYFINKRNQIRKKYNDSYAKASADRFNILTNYDMIKAYNKEVDDVNTLDKNLNDVARYGTMSNFLSNLSSFMGKIILIIPNSALYYSIIKYNAVSTIRESEDFIAYNAIFCLLKCRINSLREKLVQIFQFCLDIESNDTDLFSSDIENLILFYNYTDNKANGRNLFENVNVLEHSTDSFILHNDIRVRVGYDITKDSPMTNSRHVAEKTVVIDDLRRNNSNEVKLEARKEFVFNDRIIFRNLSVKAGESTLFHDVNLTINKGEKIALVGKNGTGKSTLIDILLRFKEYSGTIYIDGKDMKDIYKFDQRSKVSYIPQNPGLISGTVLDNLIYHDSSLSKEYVIEICRQYGYHDTFIELNNGYETDVGENGRLLSGGQKQKISFMRGVIKNGDVVICDEPTSNLDPQSEIQMIDHIFGNLSEKTVIAIIHKHSLLNRFDKIIGIYNHGIRIYTDYLEFIKDSNLF